METLKFKTNINCGGCIASVTPHLNGLSGIQHWEVDTKNSEKLLTVKSDGSIGEQQVINLLEQAGFKAEKF